MTVFLTTQYLEEADRLADRIGVLNAGLLIAEGTAAELKQRVAAQRLDLTCSTAGALEQVSRRLAGRVVHTDPAGRTVGVATDGSAGQVRALLDAADPARDLDVPGTAVLSGHVTASLLRNIISTALVAAVAYGIGFRPHASLAGVAAAFGVLMLFVAAMAWLAAAFGLAVSAPEAANAVMFMLMFFTYASSAFVPIATMPWWLRGFASHQPATPVTETIRGLLLGQPVGSRLGAALAWCGGLLAVSVVLSAALFRRRTA